MLLLVLIETLWNVKIIARCKFCCTGLVLIETLWNVKSYSAYCSCYDKNCINRNIVECKDKWKHRLWECKCVLIETLWNVK